MVSNLDEECSNLKKSVRLMMNLLDFALCPKGFISVFAEMHLDGVSGVPQLPFGTVRLLLAFGFCHILCFFTLLHKNRAHRLVSIHSDAVLLIQL